MYDVAVVGSVQVVIIMMRDAQTRPRCMPHDVAFHMPEPSRVSVFSMGGSPCRSIDGVVTGAAVKETCLAQLHVKRRSRALIVTSSILLIQHLPLPFALALALEPNHRSSNLFVYHSHITRSTLHAPRQTPSHPHIPITDQYARKRPTDQGALQGLQR